MVPQDNAEDMQIAKNDREPGPDGMEKEVVF
jgi:hypothetical protein